MSVIQPYFCKFMLETKKHTSADFNYFLSEYPIYLNLLINGKWTGTYIASFSSVLSAQNPFILIHPITHSYTVFLFPNLYLSTYI